MDDSGIEIGRFELMEELKDQGVPVIDFGPYVNGLDDGFDLVIQKVRAALDRFGFFAVVGIDQTVDVELFEQAYRLLKTALTQPASVFERCADPEGLSQHGMADYGAETAVGNDNPDPKKYIQMFRNTPLECFPEAEVPGIYEVFQNLFGKCEELGKFFHQVFARAFGLDPNHFESMLQNGDTLMRGIRYIREMCKPGDEIAGKHTDVNACTLLFTAKGQGLYVVDPVSQEKIFVNIPEGALVVNTGDQFGLYMNRIAGRHGVIQQNEMLEDRYTIVAFIHYHFKTVLQTIGRLRQQFLEAEVVPAFELDKLPLFQLPPGKKLIEVRDFFFMRITRINGDGEYEKRASAINPYTVGDLYQDLLNLGVSEEKLATLAIFHSFGDEMEFQFPLVE